MTGLLPDWAEDMEPGETRTRDGEPSAIAYGPCIHGHARLCRTTIHRRSLSDEPGPGYEITCEITCPVCGSGGDW